MRAAMVGILLLVFFPIFGTGTATAADAPPAGRASLQPVVHLEEHIYSYVPADNGAHPMWCLGSTCLARIGDDVFASGLETLEGVKPRNNCRWMLFRRDADGWVLEQVDPSGRTREPCPVAAFPDGRLFLSANPTLVQDPNASGGPARPEILEFAASDPKTPYRRMLPAWDGNPSFSQHSYRSFAADGRRRELILFQNVGYTHSEWAFLDRDGRWAAQGRLFWLKRPDPAKAPYGSTGFRVNYPNVLLRDREVHFCGASAVDQWERMPDVGDSHRRWGTRFRRLYYTCCKDITDGNFHDWVELANTHHTGGWLFPGDLWLAPDGTLHVLYIEHPIHEGLRDERFPDIKRVWYLKHLLVRDGRVVHRDVLFSGGEGISGERIGPMGSARFQVTPDDRLFAVYYVEGQGDQGSHMSENRILEIGADGTVGPAQILPLKHPLQQFMTATPRAGSPPSTTMDMLGFRAASPDVARVEHKYEPGHSWPLRISHAQVQLY